MAGVVLKEWATGALPDLARHPEPRAWLWLSQNETYHLPTGGNNQEILADWNRRPDEQRKAIDPEHWQTLPHATPGEAREELQQDQYLALLGKKPPGLDARE